MDWLAAIAWQKAANEAKEADAEYQCHMEASDPAVGAAAPVAAAALVVAAAPVVAAAAPVAAYQGGYDSDGYANDSDDGCEAGMCNDGSCCFCSDDCHGV